MLASMTGFGRVQNQYGDYRITVEIKSVNHRFCEVTIRLPRQLLFLEEKIKKLISHEMKRGRIEVFITIEGKTLTSRELQVDWSLVDQYYETIQTAKKRYEISEPISLESLFKQDEFFEIVEQEKHNEDIQLHVLNTVSETVQEVVEMRHLEGQELLEDIQSNLLYIEECCEKIAKQAPVVIEQYRERLHKKIVEFTDGVMDETRILTEVAIFADRADINEEITRIKSHIMQFNLTIHGTEKAIGRKLDFLVQELNREVNTIGSKANDIQIAECVVNMKAKIEKIKEQVQNIE
ncbi:YicC family protein [Bacillus sp. RD4P76]|uniref:YicC family protein n=2 Tax=Bacillus suaedaesalsae TaxID=2810349 RepID=A0ABS2DJ36_9BACI|nr:YicC/YloC family endoribonuclease [Bacillus suaedaesalsae]MBM6618504.1 YicC family protein [Bacillus suaedaesalsae]